MLPAHNFFFTFVLLIVYLFDNGYAYLNNTCRLYIKYSKNANKIAYTLIFINPCMNVLFSIKETT
jgi:hypothetical protein